LEVVRDSNEKLNVRSFVPERCLPPSDYGALAGSFPSRTSAIAMTPALVLPRTIEGITDAIGHTQPFCAKNPEISVEDAGRRRMIVRAGLLLDKGHDVRLRVGCRKSLQHLHAPV
jgi:hypothetical protein